MGGGPDGAMDIRVDEFQEVGGLMGGGVEGVSHHLASHAGFTDWVRLRVGDNLEASDQVLSDHLPERRVTWVTKSTMPEFQVHGDGS